VSIMTLIICPLPLAPPPRTPWLGHSGTLVKRWQPPIYFFPAWPLRNTGCPCLGRLGCRDRCWLSSQPHKAPQGGGQERAVSPQVIPPSKCQCESNPGQQMSGEDASLSFEGGRGGLFHLYHAVCIAIQGETNGELVSEASRAL
jgi:hypothetical protein